jgi:hypothetical protein
MKRSHVNLGSLAKSRAIARHGICFTPKADKESDVWAWLIGEHRMSGEKKILSRQPAGERLDVRFWTFPHWPHASCSRHPSEGKTTQNKTALFGPTCLGAQT